MQNPTAPRLLCYVQLRGHRRLHRVVYIPVPVDDLVVVEWESTDAMDAPCWEAEADPDIEDVVIRQALVGGEGVERARPATKEPEASRLVDLIEVPHGR